MKRTELGCPGHFIGAASCRFRRHTQVGTWRISTVGDYFPPRSEKRETIGSGATDFFETMAFKTLPKPDGNNEGCGCREVKDYSESECVRYATAGEAHKGHERMVAKYARRSK